MSANLEINFSSWLIEASWRSEAKLLDCLSSHQEDDSIPILKNCPRLRLALSFVSRVAQNSGNICPKLQAKENNYYFYYFLSG